MHLRLRLQFVRFPVLQDDMRGIPVIASLAGRLTSAVVMFAVLFFCLVPDEARADIGAFILVDAKSGAVIDQKRNSQVVPCFLDENDDGVCHLQSDP